MGRASEVDAIVELVRREDVRLVTLTGLGGIGKTRLGVEAARVLEPDFPDGAIYVPLATISDPNLVAPRMVQALGAEEAGHAPEEVLRLPANHGGTTLRQLGFTTATLSPLGVPDYLAGRVPARRRSRGSEPDPGVSGCAEDASGS